MGVEFNQVWDLSSSLPIPSGHNRGLTDAKWSPDGQFLATGSQDSTVHIWDVADYALKAKLVHPAVIENLSWSPDSLQVATAAQDGSVRVWDVVSRSFKGILDQTGYKFSDLAWSPDGKRIVASSMSDLVSMIWDVNSGETIKLEQGDQRCFLSSPSWSPDGRRVVTGCIGAADSPARIWDAATGKEIQQLESKDGTSQLVAWSPDGRLIAVGYSDPVVRIWDGELLKPVTRFSRHADRLVDLDFAPNSQRVVSIDTGRQVLIWEALTGSVVHSLRARGTPNSVAWSPDGKLVNIATVDPEPEIYQVWQSTGELITYAEQCCVNRQLGVDERQRFGLP
jgi:WD40 repeat protein